MTGVGKNSGEREEGGDSGCCGMWEDGVEGWTLTEETGSDGEEVVW